MRYKYSYLLLLILHTAGALGQQWREHSNINEQFGSGKISPVQANSRWLSLQKKYGNTALSIEIYGWRALTYYFQGNFSAATRLFDTGLKEAQKVKNDTLIFKFYSDLASIYQYSGALDSAQNIFEKAYIFYKAKPILEQKTPNYVNTLFKNYGKLKFNNGDYFESIVYLDIAKKNAQPKQFDSYKSFIYSDIASNFMALELPDSARHYLKAAIHFSKAPEDICDKYLKLAQIDFDQGEWAEMQAKLQQATHYLKVAVKQKKEINFPLQQLQLNILQAKYYFGLKKYALAEQKFKEIIENEKKLKEIKLSSNFLVEAYSYLQKIYFHFGLLAKALEANQSGIMQNSNGILSTKAGHYPALSSLKNKKMAIDLYRDKLKILKAAFEKTKKIELLNEHLKLSSLAIEVIDYQRNSYQMQNSKLYLSHQAQAIYGQAVEVAYLKYSQSKKPEDLERAFYFSEKNRAVLLSQSLKQQQIEAYPNVPQSHIALLKKAQKEVAVAENQLLLLSPGDKQATGIWNNKLLQASEKLAQLKEISRQKYPDFYNYQYENEPKTIEQIQKQLAGKQVMYSFTAGGGYLYRFEIAKDRLQLHRLEPLSALQQKVLKYQHAILNTSGAGAFGQAAHKLYQSLFAASHIDAYKQLLIIQEASLGTIPFEALVPTAHAHLKEQGSYLIESYSISYASSAGSFFENKGPKKQKVSLDYVAFSPSFSKENALPHNRKIAETIAPGYRSELYLDQKASKKNFTRLASTKVLHLATHGYANIMAPEKSYLLLQNDSLFAAGIYQLALPCGLAVLDACETGIGKVNSGEGTLNLARAFRYAGVQRVAMSLWKLNSTAQTTSLTRYFIENSLEGTQPAQALQQAKIAYLNKHRNDLVQGHPYYWAGLILLDSSAEVPTLLETILPYILAISICILGLYFWPKIRNK